MVVTHARWNDKPNFKETHKTELSIYVEVFKLEHHGMKLCAVKLTHNTLKSQDIKERMIS